MCEQRGGIHVCEQGGPYTCASKGGAYMWGEAALVNSSFSATRSLAARSEQTFRQSMRSL